MTTLLKNLSLSLENNDEQLIINNLNDILTHVTENDLDNIEVVHNLLTNKNSNIKKLTVHLIAEWAKTENNRKILTTAQVVHTLLQYLSDVDQEVTLNSIRAVGNICFENEEACRLIDKSGLDIILNILRSDVSRNDINITTKASGLLLNILSSHEDLQKTAMKSNIIEILEKLLCKYSKSLNSNETLLSFLLTLLSSLAEYFDEQNTIFSEKLCHTVIHIFKESNNPEISIICLEIFHGQSEKDDIKTILAKSGTCELIFELIEKYRDHVNDEDSRSVLKMACDLIVIILTGDDCMNLLYNNGKGRVYENMVTWLDSQDPDLLSTGVLAIGNFARKDVNCIQMVQNGISKKLLNLLSKYNSSESDIKIQHALLSTLKNLVIPQQNKAQILQEGLINTLYPITKVDQYLVIFKLLGTYRMVIDGQERAALDLISRKDFIERLVYWCYNSDHLGVRGEVPRLLAWMIKHCHSFKPFEILLSVDDCVKCIVEMISSNHAVMQNEAFYALNLLCIGCFHTNSSQNGNVSNMESSNGDSGDADVDKLYDKFIAADISKHLNFIINKYGEKMDKQTLDNLLTLLEQLVKSKPIARHLKSSEVPETLKKLLSNPNAQHACEKIKQLMTEIAS